MRHVPTFPARIWRYLRDEDISVRRTVVYFLVGAAVFYLLGAQYPKSDYRRLQNELTQARQDVRLYADNLSRKQRALNEERSQGALNEKTLELLNSRIDELLRENVRQKERILFYQQVFGDTTQTGEISIHHLELSPDFTPQQWRLNAILVRQGERKKFNGAYYFELVLNDGDGEKTMQVPADNHRKFEMNLYYEAQEIIALPDKVNVGKIRIVVLDAKNKVLTSSELLETSEDTNGTNGVNGTEDNGADGDNGGNDAAPAADEEAPV